MLRGHERAEQALGETRHFEVGDAEPGLTGLAGLRLGPWQLKREIGRGGMGSVWLAERVDGEFAQQVAIKVIRRGMDTEQVLERFRAERQLLASFDHPNIAQLIDGGSTPDGLPYFVMEHIQGQPIDAYASERGLAIQQRLDLFLQVCDAVRYAHQRLIVHRDIKPQNILVTASGVPKLLDFGTAKALQEAADRRRIDTLGGFQPLTPDYASPEQVRGLPTTTQSDVYSLGVVLYELLAGHSPYSPPSWSTWDVSASVLTSDIARPSVANRQLRGDLDAIVLTALQRDPVRRYASVEQLSQDILRFKNGLPVQARPDGLWYRAGKFVRRHATAVTGAALLLLALIGGAVTTAWQAREARHQADLAHEAQGRAEQRFAEVRSLANALLFDYHDAIMELPGATPVRQQLVTDALGYLNGLARDSAGDPALQRELALAYRKVAEIQGTLAEHASLGDTTGAVSSHRKSLAILEGLLVESPGDPQLRGDVAAGALELASILAFTDNVAEAWNLAVRARTLYESLASGATLTIDQRLALAQAYDLTGVISLETGQAGKALEIHGRQLELLVNAPAADQGNPALRRALSTAHHHLADAQGTFGDHETALENHRHSLRLRIGLADEFPFNTDYQRLVGVSHFWEADTLQQMGRIPEALQAFLRSLAIDDALAADDPSAHRSAFPLIRVGNMLDRLGDHAHALEFYDRAKELLREDVAGDTGNLWKRAGLIEVLALTCAALTRLSRHDAARGDCSEAANLIESTVVEPNNAVVRAALARSYTAMADALAAAANSDSPHDQRLRQARGAVGMYEKSVAIWSDMGGLDMLTEADLQEAAAVIASLESARITFQALSARS